MAKRNYYVLLMKHIDINQIPEEEGVLRMYGQRQLLHSPPAYIVELNDRFKGFIYETQDIIGEKGQNSLSEVRLRFHTLKEVFNKLLTTVRSYKNVHTGSNDPDYGNFIRGYAKLIERLGDFEKTINEEEKRLIALTGVDFTLPKIEKLQWYGTQKELAELFIMLIEKKWIKRFEESAKLAKAIYRFFELPGSEASFVQIMKPVQSKETSYKASFTGIFTKRYKRKFDDLKIND